MTDLTVPEPAGYPAVAADLRRIADRFDKAVDVPLGMSPWIHLDIQPGGDDQQVIARTDALAAVLFGTTGGASKMHDGTYHYDVKGMVGAVRVHVFSGISKATVFERDRTRELADKEAELERLRAEVARLRGETSDSTGQDFGRSDLGDDDPQPVAGRVPAHIGGVVDGGKLVTDDDEPDGRVIGRATVDEGAGGLIVGDTAVEQRDNANAAYERDESGGWRDESTGLTSGGLVPNCPRCGGDHHTVEPCR